MQHNTTPDVHQTTHLNVHQIDKTGTNMDKKDGQNERKTCPPKNVHKLSPQINKKQP